MNVRILIFLVFIGFVSIISSCKKQYVPINLSEIEKESIVGEYTSLIYSNGADAKGITIFYIDKNNMLSGRYEFFEDKTKTQVAGTLFDFERGQESEIVCTWRDSYGDGTLKIVFDEKMRKFEGKWSSQRTTNNYTWNGYKK